MDKIGEVAHASITLFGKTITFNPHMFLMTYIVMGIIILLAWLAGRNLKSVPGKLQSVFEMVIEFFEDISVSTLGKESGRKHFPLVMTLFLFILLANWIGIIPGLFHILGMFIALIHKAFGSDAVQIVREGFIQFKLIPSDHSWYSFLFHLPAGMEEPTKFLSTDFAMAILVLIIVHVNSIKKKGLFEYFASYMEPLPGEAPYIYFFFLNPFFYLNIIGQLANTVSHSFRLFGNIFGGGIIIIIVSSLLKFLFIPVVLYAFFGLFAGTIQAFVFTMLAVSYIAQME